MLVCFAIYCVSLIVMGWLFGLLNVDPDEWLPLAVAWPVLLTLILLEVFALIGYLTGEFFRRDKR